MGDQQKMWPKEPNANEAQSVGTKIDLFRTRRREVALAVLAFSGFLAACWCSAIAKGWASDVKIPAAQTTQPVSDGLTAVRGR